LKACLRAGIESTRTWDRGIKYWQEVNKEKPQNFIKTKYNGQNRKETEITEACNTHREFRNA